MLLLLFSILLSTALGYVREAADGSVCANKCSGHGECIDYSCHCFTGYHGDSCDVVFGEEDNLIPILTAGHFNVTKKNFTTALSKNPLLLVGFSSRACFKCVKAETEYAALSNTMKAAKLPFARADSVALKRYVQESGVTDLPAIVLYKKRLPILYLGMHKADSIMAFVEKQKNPPLQPLKTMDAVHTFLSSRSSPEKSLSSVLIVGFFSDVEKTDDNDDGDEVEEDDYQDFLQAAKDLQTKEDIYFGVVTSKKISDHYKKVLKYIDRTPSVLLIGENDIHRGINLDELYGEKIGLKEWITFNSVPLVGRLTPHNFQLYDKIPLPMFMLFLDLSHERGESGLASSRLASPSSTHPSVSGETSTDQQMTVKGMIGGQSGGIYNDILIAEFTQVAVELQDKIRCVFLDGTLHEDQMKSLGLFGGIERLPSLAYNTRDGNVQAPFPEELPINKDTMMQFSIDFLNGKIKTAAAAKEMAKKALQAAKPINSKNKATRLNQKEAPEEVRGVAEQFGDGAEGDRVVTLVKLANFDEVCMDEEKDVVLLLHAKGCEACAHLSVYYKRMAARFFDLDIPSLTVARMDITKEAPPSHLKLVTGALPIIVMLPASSKYAPWQTYSGVGKIKQMMEWVHLEASIPFDLPNLPHLTESNRVLYKEQIREREEMKDKQAREDERAMKLEDQERERRARKKAKAQAAAEQKDSTDDAEF